MAGMVYLLRTPASIGVLAVEFGVAIVFTSVAWRLGLPIRGISRGKNGPMSKTDLWMIALVTLTIFLLLAASTAGDRKQMGLPIF
jgi:hypothetical protein